MYVCGRGGYDDEIGGGGNAGKGMEKNAQ